MTTTIRIEGGLLSPDLLERLPELEGQKPKDFGMDARGSFVDQVASVWTDAQTYWKAFERRRAHATRTDESVTTITRDQWMIPLLEALGYQLTFQRRAAEVDGRTFTISHRAAPGTNGETRSENETDELPVHIVGYDLELGSRPPTGRGTLSPHGLMQDYLNRTEQVWGIVTNGFVLRLLRDSSYLTRPSYIEFDLKQMLEGGRLDEFILLYRLVQRTRLPNDVRDADQCWLEKYHQQAIEQGGRIRDGLREAVEETIVTLANGFLAHPKNEALRAKIREGKLDGREFYRQLLYIIYRLLFLFVAEERNLLISVAPDAKTNFDAARFYREQFSLTRLRALADEPLTAPERFDDLYLSLRTLFYALANEDIASQLGLPVLNGELFATLDDLDNALLTNRDVLQAISKLAYFYPKDEKVRRRVNYAALDVEEFGSVYESLLDLEPTLRTAGGTLEFAFAEGKERKSTGSYYTPPLVVNNLVQGVLVPVLQNRLEGKRTREDRKRTVLAFKVIDLASGSGHFLLAAARVLGRELATLEAEVDEPSPEAIRLGVRQAITHCIYGVDKNPLAVDLCKVALWLEGHAAGKPLTFLDNRIRCGDSLVGVTDLRVLQEGIPDEAFDPITGDTRAIATRLKKQNAIEQLQRSLAFNATNDLTQLLDERRILMDTPDDTPEQIRRKQRAFLTLQEQSRRNQTAAHLWTTAFIVPLTSENLNSNTIPITDVLRRSIENASLDARYLGSAWETAIRNHFFHWALEFPEVFGQGGFDVVLANPPYDVVKENRFLRYSDMKGTGNLFAHFLSRATDILAQNGGMGFVVPLSLACGETFESTRRKLYRNFGAIYASHYSIRPTQLFPGVEQRVSLLKCTDHGAQPCHVYSTRLHRWHKGDEDKVVAAAQYGAVGTLSEGVIPKVAGEFGAVVYDKIRNQPHHVAEWLARESIEEVTVYFHTVARYWIKAYNFLPFFQREGEAPGVSTKLASVSLRNRTAALRFLCVVNSSLFHYWWLTQSDEFDVLASVIFELGVPGEQAPWPSDQASAVLVDRLMESYKTNAARRQRRFGGRFVTYDEFRPRYSLKEIYAIDDMLAKVYGLTPEENEFLKTYDLEFRTDEE